MNETVLILYLKLELLQAFIFGLSAKPLKTEGERRLEIPQTFGVASIFNMFDAFRINEKFHYANIPN